MPGIFERFGGFAQKLIRTAQDLGLGIRGLLDIAEVADVEVSPGDVMREMEEVARGTELESAVSAVPPDDYIPHGMYVTTEIPWKKPYAYTVKFVGRDPGGRLTSQEYTWTFSEELTPGEVLDVAGGYVGVGGESPEFMDVLDVSVIRAEKRAGEAFR